MAFRSGIFVVNPLIVMMLIAALATSLMIMATPVIADGGGAGTATKAPKGPYGTKPTKAAVRRDLKKAERRYLRMQKDVVTLDRRVDGEEKSITRLEKIIAAINTKRARNDPFVKMHAKDLRELERMQKAKRYPNGKKFDYLGPNWVKGEIKDAKERLKKYQYIEERYHREVKEYRAMIKKHRQRIKVAKAGIRRTKTDLKVVDREISKLRGYLK